jgi:hypothetical protein
MLFCFFVLHSSFCLRAWGQGYSHSGNSVTVSWPVGSGGFVLQQNGNVANPAGWSPYGGTVSTANGVSSSR